MGGDEAGVESVLDITLQAGFVPKAFYMHFARLKCQSDESRGKGLQNGRYDDAPV